MRITDRFVSVFPGTRVRKAILDRLARQHPTVRIVWNVPESCYELIELGDDGRYHPIKLLRKLVSANPMRFEAEEPTMQNTIEYLNRCDVRRLANAYALDQWLNDVDGDQDQQDPDAVRRSEDMIREGVDREWRARGKRQSFVLDPSNGSPTVSPKARRAGSAKGRR